MTIKTASLPDVVLTVINEKGTEKPFSGEYDHFEASGSYLCRQCGLPLFRSATKFHSGCGWPSFDEAIPSSVVCEQDAEDTRMEIICARCQAHLGHVFAGENFTSKDIRHCVNSLSLDFVSDKTIQDTEEAIYAAGCFWGVEYYFKQLPGVLKTQVGYTGGFKTHPTYEEVCSGITGHYEAIRVLYDPSKLSYEKLTKFFFEIHDPTQTQGQGPDLGQQYLSVIFYYDEKQKKIAEALILILQQLGFSLATKLLPVTTFWPAEAYHQDYYQKTGKQPYCHRYEEKFSRG